MKECIIIIIIILCVNCKYTVRHLLIITIRSLQYTYILTTISLPPSLPTSANDDKTPPTARGNCDTALGNNSTRQHLRNEE